jgi:hypothetical protein
MVVVELYALVVEVFAGSGVYFSPPELYSTIDIHEISRAWIYPRILTYIFIHKKIIVFISAYTWGPY